MGELRDLVLRDYRINERRSIGRARAAFAHLSQLEVVPLRGAHDVTSRYAARRTRAGAAAATVRYELAMLRRGLTLAHRAGRIEARPALPTIRVQNARQGFFTDQELELLIAALPDPVDDMARFASITGWRISEIRSLTWDQVDRRAGLIRLGPGTTKNGEGRVFPYGAHPELAHLFRWLYSRRMGEHVFHRSGRRVKHVAGSWNLACRKLKLGRRVFHDLRRTAVRNMERAGVPRSVQMKLIGLKTESIHHRYAITNEEDLARGVALLAAKERPGGSRTWEASS